MIPFFNILISFNIYHLSFVLKAAILQVNCGDRDCDGQPCEVAEFTCPQPDGLFPDPDNCIKYQDCMGGSAMRETCPLGRLPV